MEYSIAKKEVSAQPALVQRKKTSQGPELSKAIGDALGSVFAYAQKNDIAVTGRPFARYIEVGPSSMTVEPGMCVATTQTAEAVQGDDRVQAIDLPGGFVATTTHHGPYETLHEAYAALEKWMESEGLTPAGAPWEVYVTDPTEVEDPSEWETEVYWPVS